MFHIYQVLSHNNDNFLKFNRFGIHIFFIRAMLDVQFCRLRVILVNRHISARNASWIARQYVATLFHMNQCESKGFLKNESVHIYDAKSYESELKEVLHLWNHLKVFETTTPVASQSKLPSQLCQVSSPAFPSYSTSHLVVAITFSAIVPGFFSSYLCVSFILSCPGSCWRMRLTSE